MVTQQLTTHERLMTAHTLANRAYAELVRLYLQVQRAATQHTWMGDTHEDFVATLEAIDAIAQIIRKAVDNGLTNNPAVTESMRRATRRARMMVYCLRHDDDLMDVVGHPGMQIVASAHELLRDALGILRG